MQKEREKNEDFKIWHVSKVNFILTFCVKNYLLHKLLLLIYLKKKFKA